MFLETLSVGSLPRPGIVESSPDRINSLKGGLLHHGQQEGMWGAIRSF